MDREQTTKKRFALGTADKAFLTVVGALVLAAVVLGILSRCGLTPIHNAILFYIPLLAVFVLVGWGILALVRRVTNRTVRMVLGIGLPLVLMLVLLVAVTYASYMAYYAMPQRFTTVVSPSGAHKAVVMRAIDPDEDRLNARRAARLAADPDGDPETTIADWGFVYRAYPQVLGLFYKSNADVQGEVLLGVDAATVAPQDAATLAALQSAQAARGTLMVDWLEEETVARFFVDHPGVAEGGECRVRF